MEHWQPVKGYDGLYEVSDQGRVKSLKYGKEKILKSGKSPHGYLLVNLCKDGQCKSITVHRLVAEAFIQTPNNLETVNHKDENKLNNAASNLEWMSKRDNNNYGTRNKRISETLINDNNKSKAVQMFDRQGNLLAVFPSAREAQRVTEIAQSSICLCCNGKRKCAGGFKWRFASRP